ncbi:hypothetical protein [Deinococcus cellulosilyticus]|uniref:Uncharacterized protein n=1 Tax=Deinococcus cellulosilyticus (strain DSM 18568 / NBRC 106333 / KACC 11606 / 5516J-15) TaxID=1223518 RepID=A0A511MZ40_DEIC1|nr:hypothetical protein [Deinococcus cellulosilyticus]GEM45890.1 hypothetical protein DC3_15250 [Deinococcus cellulosilyticus NBRC 106333 = KACC 11606]
MTLLALNTSPRGHVQRGQIWQKSNQQHRQFLLSRDRQRFLSITERVVAWCLSTYPEVTLWRWHLLVHLYLGLVSNLTSLSKRMWHVAGGQHWTFGERTEYGAHIQALGEGW